MGVATYFDTTYTGHPDFRNEPLWYTVSLPSEKFVQLIYYNIVMIACRFLYYIAWANVDGAFIASGISYNGSITEGTSPSDLLVTFSRFR